MWVNDAIEHEGRNDTEHDVRKYHKEDKSERNCMSNEIKSCFFREMSSKKKWFISCLFCVKFKAFQVSDLKS